jgi:hypothetical protein
MKVVNLNKEDYDVFIGRGSKWGNPLTHIKYKLSLATHMVESREEALDNYREYILENEELMNSLDELDGKVLGCYCKPLSCHGDILLELISQKKTKQIFKDINL